jgi:hypothetical protein
MRFALAAVVLVTAATPAHAGDAADDAPPTPPAASRSAALLVRVPITDGPVPGADAITLRTKASDRHCGGVAVRVKIRSSRRIPKPDPELAALFKIELPRDLDFDPKRKERRDKSTKRFAEWLEAVNGASRAVVARYESRIRDAAVAPLDKMVAFGRLAVALRWTATTFARAEIPRNVREYPEAATLYCDMLADQTDSIVEELDRVTASCRDFATQLGVGAGWWDAACAAPAEVAQRP